MRTTARPALVLLLFGLAVQLPGDEPLVPKDGKEALSWFNDVVGEWRGVGQVRRGSNRGAWRETGDFRWDFTGDGPAVLYSVEDGKHLVSLRITYDVEAGRFLVTAKQPDAEPVEFVGTIAKNVFTAESKPDDEGQVDRIVVTKLNEKRTLVRFERGRTGQKFAVRLGEVGYTREGTRLARVGEVGPVCIVTGGVGTTLVSFKGQQYYVCCEGCKQAFEDDPAGVIAEYEAKLEAKKDRG